MKTFSVGVDGGDFFPERDVKSGIQRLIKSYLFSSVTRKSGLIYNYYYFGEKQKFKNGSVNTIPLPKPFFSHISLPFKNSLDQNKVFLGFSGTISPMIRLVSRSIVFIHDFGFYDYPDLYHNSNRLKWQTEYSIHSADKVIVFSEHIKKQLVNKFSKISPEKVICIYPGGDHLNRLKSKQSPINKPYFLYVGVIKRIKNIEKLLSLFSEFLEGQQSKKVALVLVGKKEDDYWKYLKKSFFYRKCKQKLIFLDSVDEMDLHSLYQNCIGVLNYSLSEGFCYPVVEGLQLGKKVITNNLSLYHEFSPFFEGLIITRSEQQFVREMHDACRNSTKFSTKKNPFGWDTFSNKLISVITRLSL